MSLKKFLYYILTEEGKSGKVENDVVSYIGTPTPLPQTPIGWQDILIAFERSVEKHGLSTVFTLPVGFVRDGGRILRDTVYKETIEAKRYLLIQRKQLLLTLTTYNWFYKYFFRGEIDLSEVEDGRNSVNAPIIQTSIEKLIKANENTVYEFPMNDPLCVNLKMDGIPIFSSLNFLIPDNAEIGNDALIGVSFLNTDGTNFSVAGFTITQQALPPDLTVSTEYFLQVSADCNIRIRMSVTAMLVGGFIGTPPELLIKMVRGHDGFVVGLASITIPTANPYVVDVTIPTLEGDKWFLIADESFTNNPPTWHILETRLYVDVESRYQETYVKCYKRFDLYRKLIEKITGNADNAISNLCQLHNSRLITCGDAIRGLEGATLKTSLRDFFEDTDSTFMAGMEITQSGVEIEDRLEYYTEQDEIDLGNVTDLRIRPAKDLIKNTFRFGHVKQEIENVNGKYDPNGNNQFSGPIKKVTSEYEMVSPYKAGPYEIEILRTGLDGKTTTDDNSDNDVFVIAAVPPPNITATVGFTADLSSMIIGDATGFVVGQKIRITGSGLNDGVYDIIGITSAILFYFITFAQSVVDETDQNVTIEWLTGGAYTLDRPAFDAVEGLPTSEVFNLVYLTPKTMLLAHKRWIRSMNAGLDNQKIVFTSGKDNKNTLLRTELGSVVIDEDKDELISDFGDYIFLPWYFIFKTEVPVDLPELLEENPKRSFKFTDEEGNVWRGFLRVAGIAPNEYTPQEFRLLATPNNNIQLLIRG